METKVKIQKWGSDLGISIPIIMLNNMMLNEGNCVNIQDYKNKIIIEPIKKNSYNLSDLLSDINENNIHQPIEWGEPVGNEI